MTLATARILLLRLTIPADIYQSGIVVEIEGVRVKAVVDSDISATHSANLRKRRDAKSRLAKGTSSSLPRNPRSQEDDSEGGTETHEEGSSPILPTADDIAHSFLQSEPAREKAELKTAIAKSQHLDQSVISEDGDEEPGEGCAWKIRVVPW